MILSGRTYTHGTVGVLREAGMPVVEIRDLSTSPIDMSVDLSHFDCGVEIAQFLIRKGRRRAGFVGALSRSDVMGQARLEGFSAALLRAGFLMIDSEVLQDNPGFYPGTTGLRHRSRASLIWTSSIFTMKTWS